MSMILHLFTTQLPEMEVVDQSGARLVGERTWVTDTRNIMIMHQYSFGVDNRCSFLSKFCK